MRMSCFEPDHSIMRRDVNSSPPLHTRLAHPVAPNMAATPSNSGGAAAHPASSSSGLTQPARTLKRDLLTEHFRFAPETFAKGGMDLANRTMYTATAKVEQSLQQLVEKRVQGFDEEQVQRVRRQGECGPYGARADTATFVRASTASRRSSKTRSTPSLTCSRSLSSETPSPSRTTCCRTSPCLTTCVLDDGTMRFVACL